MIDERFERFSHDSIYLMQKIKARDEVVAQILDVGAIEDAIGHWWMDQATAFLASGGAGGRYPEDDFQSYLSTRSFPGLPHNAIIENHYHPLFQAITKCLTEHSDPSGTSRPYLATAWWIISSSLGFILGKAEVPSLQLFGFATHSIGGFDTWTIFHDSFARSCQKNPATLSRWIQVLKKVPNDPIAYFRVENTRDGSDGGEAHFRQEAASWIQNPGPTNLWGGPHWTERSEPSSIIHLDALLSLSQQEWLHVIDQIPAPELVRQFACRRLLHDRELILAMLDIAEPCLNQDLRPTGHPAILFLVESIYKHAEALYSTVQSFVRNAIRPQEKIVVQEARDEIAKLETEIPAWFDAAFARLSGRPDGPQIALSYAAHLLDEKLRGLGRRDEEGLDIREAALQSLMGTLKKVRAQGRCTLVLAAELWDAQEKQERLRRGWTDGGKTPPPPKRGRKLSADQGSGSTYLVSPGLPYLLAATILWSGSEEDEKPPKEKGEARREGVADELSFLTKWYQDILRGRDPAIFSVVNPHGPRNLDWVLWALSGIQIPDSSSGSAPDWIHIWGKLAPQRRRAMHWMYVEDHFATDSSILHILVGCRALDRWASTSDKASRRNLTTFWDILFDATRQIWFCSPIDPNEKSRDLLNHTIARMPYFREIFETSEQFLDWVASALFSLGGDLVAITSAVVNLKRNGMTFDEMRESFRRIDQDLAKLIQEARELYRHGLSGGTPAYFQELEEAIGERQ